MPSFVEGIPEVQVFVQFFFGQGSCFFVFENDGLSGFGSGAPGGTNRQVFIQHNHFGDCSAPIGEEFIHQFGVFIPENEAKLNGGMVFGHQVNPGQILGSISAPEFGKGEQGEGFGNGGKGFPGFRKKDSFFEDAFCPVVVELGIFNHFRALIGAGSFVLAEQMLPQLAILGVGEALRKVFFE